jgi:hypothetical protein
MKLPDHMLTAAFDGGGSHSCQCDDNWLCGGGRERQRTVAATLTHCSLGMN